jgi:multidrug efflux pump
MVPLSALMKVTPTFGPERAMRYNGFLSADINGGPAPGLLLGPGAGRGQAHRRRDAAARA